ncbi:hypothetical protein Taro_038892 [Colocasia esculenta]|uniref:Uncharacterized protein n=1 Tax=Colocasia esculenta TaxID=4460 RepID=A0A843WNJ5_COLES|nr:hypothetical protein [Colocasia esculenta]
MWKAVLVLLLLLSISLILPTAKAGGAAPTGGGVKDVIPDRFRFPIPIPRPRPPSFPRPRFPKRPFPRPSPPPPHRYCRYPPCRPPKVQASHDGAAPTHVAAHGHP